MRVGADPDVVLQRRAFKRRVLDATTLAHDRVAHDRIGTDARARADPRLALEDRSLLDEHVRRDLHVGVDLTSTRVSEGHDRDYGADEHEEVSERTWQGDSVEAGHAQELATGIWTIQRRH